MQKKEVFLILIPIFILAVFLRFYKLGQVPPSLDWDEASLGYNAYTILKTGRDEYGNMLPISIRSFNDYKASVYVYLSAIPVAIFGLNEFSVRFVSAFFGSLTVLLTFFLIKALLSLDEIYKKISMIALMAAFLLAISPWHIQFSRVAFESNLSLSFFIGGIYLFLLSIKKNYFLPFSVIFFGLSVFSYHSAKIVVPVFVLGLIIIFKNKIFNQKIYLFLSAFLSLIFIGILLYSFKLGGSSRFSSASIFKQDLGLMEALRLFISNYFKHFDFNFLFVKGDPQVRHHASGFAQLYLWELPLVIAGLVFFIKAKLKGCIKATMLWWFAVAPLAAALTTDVPNAVRALLFLPTFQFFIAFGIYSIYNFLRKLYRLLFLGILFLLFTFYFLLYFHMYFFHYPLENSQDWQYGYKQAVDYVNEHKGEYQKIIVTTTYDQPYIYFLFYNKPLIPVVNNGEYSKGFDNLDFRPIDWEEDSKLANVLLIGSASEIPDNANLVKKINFLNEEPAFRIASP